VSWFDLVALVLVLAAAFSYLNHRLLKLPNAIGLTALTLLASVVLVILGQFTPAVVRQAEDIVHQFNFSNALLHGMLGFLLFAGSLQIDLGDLQSQKWTIAVLASVGILLSTVIVGGLVWCLLTGLGISMSVSYCLLFGALISPTDPIAVLTLLKNIGAPKSLEVTIAGESLLNDGVALALFIGIRDVATGGQDFDGVQLVALFLREAVGGAGFGLGLGLLVYYMIRSVDNYQVEIMLSLALVAGGYALADALHLSGPIAMVVAGLLIGNPGRSFAMSPTTVEHLDLFWSLVDEILNAVLFVLIGIAILVLPLSGTYLVAGLGAVPVVLVARWVSVGLPIAVLRHWQSLNRSTVQVLTWGGLRGGIPVALALSLPGQLGGAKVPEQELILVMTYVVVVFSILIQGLTIGPLSRRWLAKSVAQSSRMEGCSPGSIKDAEV